MISESSIAIQFSRVGKCFGSLVALDQIDLKIPKGAMYGLIGPNGSGKTTMIRLILRILMPDSGVVEVLGKQNGRAADDRTGYLPEERGLYRHMKVGEVLMFFARLKSVRNPKASAERWLERLGLSDRWGAKVQSLSKGMSQKLQLACALIHHPEIVILDEPFSGLDPVNADLLREVVLEQRREGTTVLFSTHDMAMAERMCDHVVMVHQGHKVLDGPVDDIKQEIGSKCIHVCFAETPERLDAIDGVKVVRNYGREFSLELEENIASRAIIRSLNDCGDIRNVAIQRQSLHEIFVALAGNKGTSNRPDVDRVTTSFQGTSYV